MTAKREHWGSKIGFILATAGSAIGLGSLWRFPYIAGQNGGGAFVLLYIFFTFVVALPIFYAELTLGREAQKSSILAYSNLSKNSLNWRLLGWLNLIGCILILSYYCVVSGWTMSYMFMSLTEVTSGKTPEEIRGVFHSLQQSPGVNILWLFIFIGVNVAILVGGVKKGIEHWSKILMPVLFIILIALFIYACTLSGFEEGISFCYAPKFSDLTPSAILNALGMAFFTLSVGVGVILTYGSYMKVGDNIPKNGMIVCLMTIFVSLIAAMIIFPIVFTYNLPPAGGPGLIFETLPIVFEQLPGTMIISFVFFSLLFFAALTSTVSIFEVIVANFMEVFGHSRKKALLIGAVICFFLGIPCALSPVKGIFPAWSAIYGRSFFDTISFITASWIMPIGALFASIFIGWKLERKTMHTQFLEGVKQKSVFGPWWFSIRWIAPIAVVLIILHETGIFNLII